MSLHSMNEKISLSFSNNPLNDNLRLHTNIREKWEKAKSSEDIRRVVGKVDMGRGEDA